MLMGRQVLAFVVLILAHVLHATNWWLLGMPSSYQSGVELTPTSYKDRCRTLPYLVERQRELCGKNKNILATVSLGAKMGIDECQYQFHSSRWNCSTFSDTPSVFGGVLSIKSREKAYIYAISAAGVAYAITRACSKGEITECGCDETVRQRPKRGRFEWGGCSEDIRFGEKFSKDFVDSRESGDTADGLMNLHNNEAGRRMIRSQMKQLCKCHGVSGSCTIKVCWRKMAPFRQIGAALLEKFDGASEVKLVQRRKKKLRPVSRDMKRPTKKDLIFLQDSPDYCERNETLGVLGTRGRLCNKTSHGLEGCSLLCCGRGYQTRLRDVEEKCNCRFVWCCRVDCDRCSWRKEEHVCN